LSTDMFSTAWINANDGRCLRSERYYNLWRESFQKYIRNQQHYHPRKWCHKLKKIEREFRVWKPIIPNLLVAKTKNSFHFSRTLMRF
jgi:hypothetical protein